jgi:hypothetical protein
MTGGGSSPIEPKSLAMGLFAGLVLGAFLWGIFTQEADGERWDHCRAFIRAQRDAGY